MKIIIRKSNQALSGWEITAQAVDDAGEVGVGVTP